MIANSSTTTVAPAAATLPPTRGRCHRQTAQSRMRLDLPTGDWVTVAGHRQARGWRPDAEDCPLCPSRPGHPTEIPASDYDVVVFENRFPALTMWPKRAGASRRRPGADGRSVRAAAAGRRERAV